MASKAFHLGFARAATTAVMAVLAAACASPGDPPAHDGDAPTFVSLNPCIDAILVEVAEPGQILALSHYSRDPASSSIPQAVAERYGTTGGTVEEVLARRPDIVLASSFITPSARSALERLGLRVETFGSPVTVEESAAQVRDLALLTGNPAKGEALVRQMQATGSRDVPAVDALLWQAGEIVPGETTLAAEEMRRAGLSSHSAARGLGQGARVSLESVLADPPQILIVAGTSEGQRHPALAAATKATHVAQLDSRLLYCGGPTIPKLRERLNAIHAEYEATP